MKKVELLFLVACFAGLLAGCTNKDFVKGSSEAGKSGELYYYYFDRKVPLKERQDLAFIKFCDSQSKDSFVARIDGGLSTLRPYSPSGDKEQVSGSAGDMLLVQSSSPEEIDGLIKELKADPSVVFVSKALEYEGSLVGVSDEFSVKLRKGTSQTELERLAAKFGCAVSQREFFGKDIFFVKVDKASEFSVLELANSFYETGLFEFTSPDFYTFDAFSI